MKTKSNIDVKTVEGFGEEWSRFRQDMLSLTECEALFNGYFHIMPWQELPRSAVGFDLGCGSGRWAMGVAPRVGVLHCIDASEKALQVARKNLQLRHNCVFHLASVDALPLDDNSMDFGYSLGVLHHVPDTEAGLTQCVSKLKPGAPFLLYLYYALDNKPRWFRTIWRLTDTLRQAIAVLPHTIKKHITDLLAMSVYLPLARVSRLLEKIGVSVTNVPLSAYRNSSFYSMRTDAYDRFATRLEQRFTREQIKNMMERAGLRDIVFSESVPFWCAVGRRL